MSNILLSVVIPVYNCAPVILRCLESIDYADAEIIVVDDGSKDNSADLVNNYAKQKHNVRLIKKENGGVSSARNVGIEAALGKYIMFVDADDYVFPNAIEKVLGMAENAKADVVKYAYYTMMNEKAVKAVGFEGSPITSTIIKGKYEALKRYDIPDYLVWDGMYLRSVLMDHHLRFHTDLHLHEDDVFMGELYCHAETVVVTNLLVYCYVVASAQSSTHNQKITKQRMLINSSCLAIGYRGDYVMKHCPKAMPLERLKYMRWVCQPKTALEAGYSLKEYKEILSEYKAYACWPVDYNWMHVAHMDWSWKIRMKNRVKTFLCNHPGLAYGLLKNKYKK